MLVAALYLSLTSASAGSAPPLVSTRCINALDPSLTQSDSRKTSARRKYEAAIEKFHEFIESEPRMDLSEGTYVLLHNEIVTTASRHLKAQGVNYLIQSVPEAPSLLRLKISSNG